MTPCPNVERLEAYLADDLAEAQLVLAGLPDARRRALRLREAADLEAALAERPTSPPAAAARAAPPPAVRSLGDEVAARDDLMRRLEEAMARVQARVEPHTWEAFRLIALEGLPGAAAAAFKARSKVQQMLQQEVADLERE